MRMQELRPASNQQPDGATQGDSFQMRLEDVENYLASLLADHTAKTLARYRYLLRVFYDALPADKRIRKNTLAEWSAKAVNSYSPNYIDRVCSACNAWLRYMGHGDCQWSDPRAVSSEPGQEITREEYLHMLDTAKFFGREQAYLLAKVFVTTGISAPELSAVTAEAVRMGKLETSSGAVLLPAGLCHELVDYAARKGVHAGPIFVTRSGRLFNVPRVFNILRGLGTEAGLAEGKSRPSTLQRLYRDTKEEARAMAAETVEQAMNEQADMEIDAIQDGKQQIRVSGVKNAAGNVETPTFEDSGILMTREDIVGYLASLSATGRMSASQRYRSILEQLYQDLPEDKRIRKGTLIQWIELLRDKGYAANTIGNFAIVANKFLDYVGHREYQLSELPKQRREPQPELTRSEYLQLLKAAKAQGREREYLLVKLFASCDLPVQELGKVTVEAAKDGGMTVSSNRIRSVMHMPRCLCQELLAYAERQEISRGPIFTSNRGNVMSRANVVQSISKLSEAAEVPGEKCNPQCLRRLYKATKAAAEANFALLVEQAMDRQAEQEKLTAGWEV